MVVPWMAYSIWKNWVIHVLVFLVFHVFSTAELISLCKTVNLAVWAFSSIFLHDFTLFGIDMHQNRSISLFFNTIWPLSLSPPCQTQMLPLHFASSLQDLHFAGFSWRIHFLKIDTGWVSDDKMHDFPENLGVWVQFRRLEFRHPSIQFTNCTS